MVRQMRGGKRKTKRYRMRHAISDRGACISVPDSQDVSDIFMLLLAENGSPWRRSPRDLAQAASARCEIRNTDR